MSEPKITINVMPGAQMNGYVKEQHNYFGTVQQISSCEAKNGSGDAEETEVVEEVKEVANECDELLVNDVFSDELFTTNQQLLQLIPLVWEIKIR